MAPLAPAHAEEIPLTTVCRLTAQRLAASAREAPHFYLTVVADAGNLPAFRARANGHRGADVKITVTDLLIRACGTALTTHPEVNASWDETRILRHRHISIGIAVATGDGLIVPVVRDSSRSSATPAARPSPRSPARPATSPPGHGPASSPRTSWPAAPSPSATSACTASGSSPP